MATPCQQSLRASLDRTSGRRRSLAWFSPLPQARTDIANFTARLLPVLTQRHDVTLWCPAEEWDKSLEEFCPVRSFNPRKIDWKALNWGDYAIYQIGNDHRFHEAIMEVSRQHPGIVTLHDLHLHELVYMSLRKQPDGLRRYLGTLLHHHGSDALQRASQQADEPKGLHTLAEDYPLTGHFLEFARGVILHNQSGLDHIKSLCAAPAMAAPLPFTSRQDLPALTAQREPDGTLRLVILGFLHGENRRLRPILEALSRFPQRDQVTLEIIGDLKDPPTWQRLIGELGLTSQVRIRGFLAEEDLTSALNQADLALNLRWPSRGESSGSLLRYWSHALPVLLTPTGTYAELPSEVTAFVDPENEQGDLHQHWSDFLQDSSMYQQLGHAGRQYLDSHHTAEAYVDALDRFLDHLDNWRGRTALDRYARRVTREFLQDLPHTPTQKHLITRLAGEFASWSEEA